MVKKWHRYIKRGLRLKHFYVNLFLQRINHEATKIASILGLDSRPMPTNPAPPRSSLVPNEPRFFDLLLGLLRRPQQLLVLWNWKSALLSIVLRGPIFFVAGVRQGWRVAIAALFTESVFCALSAGFYGAVVQSLKDAEPQWLTGVFLTVVMPVIFQVLEYLLHWFRGTPHLRIAGIVSLVVSALSALFNWYAMRRGTLLVGREGGGFGGDLRRLPQLLFGFLAFLPRKIAGENISNEAAKKKTPKRSQQRSPKNQSIVCSDLSNGRYPSQ